MNWRIRKYSWQLVPGTIKDIRQQVFINEQKVPPALEWDSTDEIADHYLMVLTDNTPIGVARVFSTLGDVAHIGRMAILPGFRGQGFGQQLLRHLMSETGQEFPELRLSAQEHAVPFYQASGFHLCSDAYDDAGIPHFDMRCYAPELVLARLDDHPRPMISGEDSTSWLFDDEQSLIQLMDSIVGQARQRVWLYDRFLEHDLYDRSRFRELLSGLARHHRASEVRILIHDDKPLIKRRHRLVELTRRLPSHMAIRLVNDELPLEDQPFLLADRDGVVYRHEFDGPGGFAGFAHGGRVKLLEDAFQRMWDGGRESLELRQLPL
ncbi:GNAT family N-acetyltransferase [Marinobacter confluentis]|uniref:GNAT family N-acetyltransferase n=1 Tax=Marinobacter confluentis TaxID=1697557 RepID=A0A4Z1BFB6_9GAMM|nr:GNAT family N-acetyltransferase [Marinobacter confluentis]TGN41424.1 GNAT family N-acetyltransferase [Marinobacter confluentis]